MGHAIVVHQVDNQQLYSCHRSDVMHTVPVLVYNVCIMFIFIYIYTLYYMYIYLSMICIFFESSGIFVF